MADNAPLDIVVRGGTIVDGSGGEPFRGDVGVKDGRIFAIGDVADRGKEEIDATGCIVTPGFVDVHTHYDGQAIWSQRMSPSSSHGVTTVVMGNCGVGFAPCRPGDHDLLVSAMEGVEDIPEIVMTEGLPWDWETFPQFMDALDSRPHDIDIAAFLPHSALRVYVMGERGANREVATDEDIARMAELTKEAISVGAMGFATSSLPLHRRGDGEFIPSFRAGDDELLGIAGAIRDSGKGIFQMVCTVTESDQEARDAVDVLEKIVNNIAITVTFTLAQTDKAPDRIRDIAEEVTEINARTKGSLRPQIFPRPVGILVGFTTSTHPFAYCPSYQKIEHLPLAERVTEMRKPEVRARIVNEEPLDPTLPIMKVSRMFERMFPMRPDFNYEPSLVDSAVEVAKRRGTTAEEVAYDWLLEDDGEAILYIAAANYSYGNLDMVVDLMTRPDSVLGLGDGGAHYGLICDSSYPTFVLSHLARDRSVKVPLPEAVRSLAFKPAEMIGLKDRGLLAVGYKADINVIDHARLRLHKPFVVFDLPARGRRITQTAEGYRATIVNGELISRDDQPTGKLPGRLVRGAQAQPVAA